MFKPHAPFTVTADEIKRFWALVSVGTSNDCWEWSGFLTKKGYGMFGVGDRTRRANRVAWTIQNGPIPQGLLVCHHCDNPPCCNPSHLFLGTHMDNMRDMVEKGRSPIPSFFENFVRGEKQHSAKLTDSKVLNMCQRYKNGDITFESLATEYGISKFACRLAIQGRTWKHVPDAVPKFFLRRTRLPR